MTDFCTFLLVGSRVGEFSCEGMEGAIYAPDPEESAQMLNLLTEVGLVGPRLAVSHGNEQVLARQLVDRLGLELKPWHVAFVVGQVREAVQMADLDERVVGTSSTRSMQNLLDARMAMDTRASERSPGLADCAEDGYIGKDCKVEKRPHRHRG